MIGRFPSTSLLAVSLALAFVPAASAQTIDAGYSVGTWPGFRSAAVTHTFDDNDLNQQAIAVPLFNQYGFRLTLYAITGTNTGWKPIDWAKVQAAAAAGHEIGVHTVSHPYLNTLDEAGQRAQIGDAVDAIRAHVPSQAALTLAYPYCVKGTDSVVSEYVIAARTCQGNVERATPTDFLGISSMVVGSESTLRTATDLNGRVRQAEASGGWVVFLIHGIDNDGGWSSIASSELGSHIRWLNKYRDSFWVDTFSNIVRYIRERNAASVHELQTDGLNLVVEVTDGLDDTIYDRPLTIRRVLPEEWPSATAWHDGVEIASRVVTVESTRFVEFEAVPDRGYVSIARSEATGIETGDAGSMDDFGIDVYPNPLGSAANFGYRVSRAGHVRIQVYDMLGRRIETVVDGFRPSGSYVAQWDTGDLYPGAYIVHMNTGSSSRSGIVLRSK